MSDTDYNIERLRQALMRRVIDSLEDENREYNPQEGKVALDLIRSGERVQPKSGVDVQAAMSALGLAGDRGIPHDD